MNLAIALLVLQAAPPTADQVIATATKQARRDAKNVFVYFGASWCSWCRKTDDLLKSPTFAAKFEGSYVIAKITIRERDERRALENTGWEKVLFSIRGNPDRDVPYFAILDSRGKKLGDGFQHAAGKVPGNGGYPKTAEEADAFVDLIRRTGNSFGEQDLSKLRAYFLPS